MTNPKFEDLVEAARLHYENLKADLENASTRIEHLRISVLAQEAENLYINLRMFEMGLVYTHTAGSAGFTAFGPMHE
jgi:hypothetical protein